MSETTGIWKVVFGIIAALAIGYLIGISTKKDPKNSILETTVAPEKQTSPPAASNDISNTTAGPGK